MPVDTFTLYTAMPSEEIGGWLDKRCSLRFMRDSLGQGFGGVKGLFLYVGVDLGLRLAYFQAALSAHK